MLDIRLIRETPDFVKERLATRGGEAHLRIEEILECDKQRRATETRLQQLRADRKRVSKEIGGKKARGEDTSAVEIGMRGIGEEIDHLNAQAAALEITQREFLLHLPNLPHADAPVGEDAQANPVIRTWGEVPQFTFTPKSHVELGEQHGLFDFERAAKITGSAFTCFIGAGARLERVLLNFLLDLHTREHGYTEVSPPFLVRPEALLGTSQLPKFADQLYRCADDDVYLAPNR
jgi:seryl-tRNA synthetase